MAPNFVMPELFKSGWARRPKNGHMYGAKHISRYRSEIADMFERGLTNSSEKCSAAVMWEELLTKYPGRYDLPSEQEIRQEIGRLYGLQKKGRDIRSTTSGRRGRKGMDAIYERALIEIVGRNPTVKPKEGHMIFLQRFENHEAENFPSESQIKSKISSLKQLAKKARENRK